MQMQSFTIPDPNSIPPDWKRRGRKYIIKTEALPTQNPQAVFSLTNHWVYEPSVVLPCPATNSKYVFLLNRNRVFGQGEDQGEVVTARTSDNPDSGWGSETVILSNHNIGGGLDYVDNVCDMIDCRPIWDGSQWHLYIQAAVKQAGVCVAEEDKTGVIVEAVGNSLTSPFTWVKDEGTNNARIIIEGTGSAGIGEALQAFNPTRYGLPGWPFLLTYNDWGCDDSEFCGHGTFGYLSEDDSEYAYWYGPSQVVYLEVANFDSTLIFADAILLASLDAGRCGHPGIGFTSVCYNSDRRWAYCKGVGFFDNPSNVPYAAPLSQPYTTETAPNHGWPFAGALESISSDGQGPRMMTPRLARNEYGYVRPESYHGYPRKWVTYLYYNPSQINDNAGDPCLYNRWDNSSQSVGVSRLTITEESAQRIRT
jgi:hypothetical protein